MDFFLNTYIAESGNILFDTWPKKGNLNTDHIPSTPSHTCFQLLDLWTNFIKTSLHLQDKGTKNSFELQAYLDKLNFYLWHDGRFSGWMVWV